MGASFAAMMVTVSTIVAVFLLASCEQKPKKITKRFIQIGPVLCEYVRETPCGVYASNCTQRNLEFRCLRDVLIYKGTIVE